MYAIVLTFWESLQKCCLLPAAHWDFFTPLERYLLIPRYYYYTRDANQDMVHNSIPRWYVPACCLLLVACRALLATYAEPVSTTACACRSSALQCSVISSILFLAVALVMIGAGIFFGQSGLGQLGRNWGQYIEGKNNIEYDIGGTVSMGAKTGADIPLRQGY